MYCAPDEVRDVSSGLGPRSPRLLRVPRPRLLLPFVLFFGDGDISLSRAVGGDVDSDPGVGPKFAESERTCPPRNTLKLFAATPVVPPGVGGPPRGNAPSKLKVLKWESAALPRGFGDFDFE